MTTEHTDVTIPGTGEAQTALQLLPAVLLPSLSGNGEAELVVPAGYTDGVEAAAKWHDKRAEEAIHDFMQRGTGNVARHQHYAAEIRSLAPPAAPMPGWTMRLAHIEQRTPIEKQAAELVAGIENLGGHPLLSSAQSAVDLALRTLGKWHDDGEIGANAPASPAPILHTVAGVAETLEFNAQHIVAEEELGDALAMLEAMRRVMHEEAAKLRGLILTPDAKDKRIADAERERDAALRLQKMSHKATALQTMEHRALKAEAQLSALNAKRGNADLIEAATFAQTAFVQIMQAAHGMGLLARDKDHDTIDAMYPLADEASGKILAALSRSPAPEGMGMWQPIETAPKDGRSIMVWITADKYVGEHCFAPVSICDDGTWWDDSTGDQIAILATHWQPLPAAPSLNKEEGE